VAGDKAVRRTTSSPSTRLTKARPEGPAKPAGTGGAKRLKDTARRPIESSLVRLAPGRGGYTVEEPSLHDALMSFCRVFTEALELWDAFQSSRSRLRGRSVDAEEASSPRRPLHKTSVAWLWS